MTDGNARKSQRSLLRRCCGLPLLLAAAWLIPPDSLRAAVPAEYDVKAAFLSNFTKFVDWPESAFTDERSALKICVLGKDPIGKSLQSIAGANEPGRKRMVLRKAELRDPAICQVLFISRSERGRLPALLSAVRDVPVLTVGDTQGFLEQGGIINFVREGSAVRFEINQEAAERAGLKISSKLMRLASRVIPPRGAS
jgi:uncharacterized protein DUF4154